MFLHHYPTRQSIALLFVACCRMTRNFLDWTRNGEKILACMTLMEMVIVYAKINWWTVNKHVYLPMILFYITSWQAFHLILVWKRGFIYPIICCPCVIVCSLMLHWFVSLIFFCLCFFVFDCLNDVILYLHVRRRL